MGNIHTFKVVTTQCCATVSSCIAMAFRHVLLQVILLALCLRWESLQHKKIVHLFGVMVEQAGSLVLVLVLEQDLNEEVQFLIVSNGRPIKVAPGHNICRQGDMADNIWLLHQGLVSSHLC